MNVDLIIFSKDRACQLDLLLKSMERHLEDVYLYSPKVLYTTTNTFYENGYSILKGRYPKVEFVREKLFKSDLLKIRKPSSDVSIFGVDDDVFLSHFNLNDKRVSYFLNDGRMAALSLRVHPNVTYCYPEGRAAPKPKVIENDLSWGWRGERGDWGYPMSIDFSVFRTSDIDNQIKSLPYINPNTFEGYLSQHPINRPRMIMYSEKPVIVGIPVNKVQSAPGTIWGTISADFLNRKYIEGNIISLDKLFFKEMTAPHVETDFFFEKRL